MQRDDVESIMRQNSEEPEMEYDERAYIKNNETLQLGLIGEEGAIYQSDEKNNESAFVDSNLLAMLEDKAVNHSGSD